MSKPTASFAQEIVRLADSARSQGIPLDLTVPGQDAELRLRSDGDNVVFDFGGPAGKQVLNGSPDNTNLIAQLRLNENKASISSLNGKPSALTVGERVVNLLLRAHDKAGKRPVEEQALEVQATAENTAVVEALEEPFPQELDSDLMPEQIERLKSVRPDQKEESDLFPAGFRTTLEDGTPVVLADFRGKIGLKWDSEARLTPEQREFLASFDYSERGREYFDAKDFPFTGKAERVWDACGRPIQSRLDNMRPGKPVTFMADGTPRGIKIVPKSRRR